MNRIVTTAIAAILGSAFLIAWVLIGHSIRTPAHAEVPLIRMAGETDARDECLPHGAACKPSDNDVTSDDWRRWCDQYGVTEGLWACKLLYEAEEWRRKKADAPPCMAMWCDLRHGGLIDSEPHRHDESTRGASPYVGWGVGRGQHQ
jgi:hypothetical protein